MSQILQTKQTYKHTHTYSEMQNSLKFASKSRKLRLRKHNCNWQLGHSDLQMFWLRQQSKKKKADFRELMRVWIKSGRYEIDYR